MYGQDPQSSKFNIYLVNRSPGLHLRTKYLIWANFSIFRHSQKGEMVMQPCGPQDSSERGAWKFNGESSHRPRKWMLDTLAHGLAWDMDMCFSLH